MQRSSFAKDPLLVSAKGIPERRQTQERHDGSQRRQDAHGRSQDAGGKARQGGIYVGFTDKVGPRRYENAGKTNHGTNAIVVRFFSTRVRIHILCLLKLY